MNDFNGNEVTTHFFVENEVIIEVLSMFQRVPSQENIVCITDCECWRLDYDTFQELFHKNPQPQGMGKIMDVSGTFCLQTKICRNVYPFCHQKISESAGAKSKVIQFAPLKQIASYLWSYRHFSQSYP